MIASSTIINTINDRLENTITKSEYPDIKIKSFDENTEENTIKTILNKTETTRNNQFMYENTFEISCYFYKKEDNVSDKILKNAVRDIFRLAFSDDIITDKVQIIIASVTTDWIDEYVYCELNVMFYDEIEDEDTSEYMENLDLDVEEK